MPATPKPRSKPEELHTPKMEKEKGKGSEGKGVILDGRPSVRVVPQ